MSSTGTCIRHPSLDALIGRDRALREVVERAVRIAPARVPVLVLGESGTGKELLARLLHELGPSPGGPFVAVNCGALARGLAESELFGHERGAFTGAGLRRSGWFEEASGGTLVLDEIGELPLELQPKLLRVLETGRLRRVGGQGEIPVELRVVALTLRDLRAEARRGSFRTDLYHRLSGVEVHLPPLRDRAADIPLLVEHFLDEVAAEAGRRRLAAPALTALCGHRWPGNVRELRNVVRGAAFLSDCTIEVGDLELGSPIPELRIRSHAAEVDPPPARRARSRDRRAALLALPGRRFDEMEREIYRWALRSHGGSRRRAARALGISRSTFCDRIRRLRLAEEIPESAEDALPTGSDL
jgi:two-component system, NtrC family, nitrogen regulation response regulator GlnG